jgi:hypothetical protein
MVWQEAHFVLKIDSPSAAVWAGGLAATIPALVSSNRPARNKAIENCRNNCMGFTSAAKKEILSETVSIG